MHTGTSWFRIFGCLLNTVGAFHNMLVARKLLVSLKERYFIAKVANQVTCTRSNIFRQWTIGGKVPWESVLQWTVIYHGITGYTSVSGPLAAVIRMIEKLVKTFEGFEPVFLQKALTMLTEKPYTDAAQRSSVLSYSATETSWSTSLSWRCVYLHVGYIDSSMLHWWADILWYRDISQPSGALAFRLPFRQWSTDGKCWIGWRCVHLIL